MLTHATSASLHSALRPRPVPPFYTFYFFGGGDFFKIEWAEMGRGSTVILSHNIVAYYNNRYTVDNEKWIGEIR